MISLQPDEPELFLAEAALVQSFWTRAVALRRVSLLARVASLMASSALPAGWVEDWSAQYQCPVRPSRLRSG